MKKPIEQRYEKSISDLSRETGHSRNTVKKAISGEPYGYMESANQPIIEEGQDRRHTKTWRKQGRE